MDKNMAAEKRKKLLIVDDEAQIVEIISRAFNKRCNYEITSAASGEDALKILESSKPDAIIMDIMMPGLTGWETIRRIKAKQETKNIPIIVVSIVHESEVEGLDKELGVVAYVDKPFDIDELWSAVHGVIGEC